MSHRRTPFRTTLLAGLAAAALQAPHAHAQAWWPQVTFSGYGTVGAVHSDNDRADYLVDAFKPNGPGHSRDVSWDVDSRLALQATAQLTPRLTGVVQVIAQQRHDNSYTPSIEWANLKLDVTPDLSVRVGRIVLPVFDVTWDTPIPGSARRWRYIAWCR
jgi:hypothetical protein